MENYRELVILQHSMVLVDRIKEIAGTFPTAERYGLVEEMQQVVSAIPANVVQGYEQKNRKLAGQFIVLAQRATDELESLLLAAHKQGYISPEDMNELQEKLWEIGKLLTPILRQFLLPPA